MSSSPPLLCISPPLLNISSIDTTIAVSIGAFTDLDMTTTSPTTIHPIDNILHHHQVSIDIINTILSSQVSTLIYQQSDITEIKSTLRQLSQTLAEISSKLSYYPPPPQYVFAAPLQSQPDSPIHPPSPTPFASPLSNIDNPTNHNYGIDISSTSALSKTAPLPHFTAVAAPLLSSSLHTPSQNITSLPTTFTSPHLTTQNPTSLIYGQIGNNIIDTPLPSPPSTAATHTPVPSKTVSSNNVDNVSTIQTMSFSPPSQPTVILPESHYPTTHIALKSPFHPFFGSTTLGANRQPLPILQLSAANSQTKESIWSFRSTKRMRLISFLLLLAILTPTFAWKKDEFRNCNRTPFCKRARTRKPGSAPSLVVSDVTLLDGHVTAHLTTKPDIQQVSSESDPESKPETRNLIVELFVYDNGILRQKIDENYSDAISKRIFQVLDVLLSNLDDRKLFLSRFVEKTADYSVVFLTSELEAVIKHDPFEIVVRDSSSKSKSKDPILSLNSYGLFDFETLRPKKEGEDWEERFRSHTDSGPNGPQSISFDLSFHDAEFVSGPEKLELQYTRGLGVEDSEPYRLFNLDVFEYLHDSPFGLYGSIPYMISHGEKYPTGFFWLNAAEMQIDVLSPGWNEEETNGNGTRVNTFWMSDAGIIDAFFMVGTKPKDVLKQYASLTGTQAMPQEFPLGYHQCRWNYRDEEDVANVDSGFDEHDIPYDVLWLDIEHADGKKYFTWDNMLFPNPKEKQNKLSSKGRHMVIISINNKLLCESEMYIFDPGGIVNGDNIRP